MGISLSCPGDDTVDESFESVLRSVTLDDELYAKSPLRSASFNGRDSEPAGLLKSWGSGKLIIRGSLSFNRRGDRTDVETEFSITTPLATDTKPEKALIIQDIMPASFKMTRFAPSFHITNSGSSSSSSSSPKHDEAAVKLQKVYKSFRTRRQLADCAVLVEQRWWKLLDFALLKRSSVSFFDIGRPESVVSKWSRAKSRAAKVGKGLSKDEKAQKLALQHWLEAIDPRHRYGHNLHFYYDRWLRCESRQPFFYWLDVGEGKEVSIDEKCTRSKLQLQCIKYLGPKEREAYEVIVADGKFLYKKSKQTLDTSEGPKDSKWIFVLSTSKTLYVGQKRKGTFQHSSFLAGGATSAAGRLEVDNGTLKSVWPHSGHYRPTEENFQELVNFLKDNDVDLTDVKESPTGGEEELYWSRLRSSRSEADMITRSNTAEENEAMQSADNDAAAKSVPAGPEESDEEDHPRLDHDRECQQPAGTKEEEEEDMHVRFRKENLFVEEPDESEEEASVPSELILRRMNSKKGLKSLQLGKQLSFKWTTGAGPRIGCVRDYPSELQARALEQVSLSPRGSTAAATATADASRVCSSPQSLHSPTVPKLPEMMKNDTNSDR